MFRGHVRHPAFALGSSKVAVGFFISLYSFSRICFSYSLSVGGCDQCTKHGREEIPHVRGQGQWSRVPGCDSTGTAGRSYPASEVRGGGREKQPHIQGAVAVWVQEGLEELSQVEGHEGWQ